VSQAGGRVAVIDVPLSRPARLLNGVQIVDAASHDPFFQPATSYPPALIADVTARFGTVAQDDCDRAARAPRVTRAAITQFVDLLVGRVRWKGDVARHLLDQGDWDLFVTVFGESHCIGHHGWHIHESSHPLHDRALAREIGDPVRDVYRALDAEIGRLLEALDRRTQAIVLLSHGMRPALDDKNAVLDEVLFRLDPSRPPLGANIFRTLKRAWHGLPTGIRRKGPVRSLMSAVTPGLRGALSIPHRHRRRCFAVPADTSVGAIRINLIGRESEGLVAPGAEYRGLVESLRRELAALADPVTGTPFVTAVHVTADLFAGPYLDDLPDLLVEFEQRHHFSAVSSPRIGTAVVPEMFARTGDHQNAGLFASVGREIPPAAIDRAIPVEDFAPTIGRLLGVPIEGVNGRVIDELLPRRLSVG
jgi:predicted AlkP superfamily phosphohydrolase/phosphomutase